ncbi:phasin family protein [Methylobacterium sp. NEAU K]|uniref:phasin family protein n=1 Tax=Methylobacterium sp. NEAU K TaxID=3064946 RepID=UPI0027329E1C|nr:phasin family protein [Methylobacterium sp. NEAU K]MDP4003327.1 phasin family protein [Methylobacterium sp. NEAU K]
MQSKHTAYSDAQISTDPAEAVGAGLNAWQTVAFGLPMRLAAETLRFTGRRLQAQADHLAALARCGSIQKAVELQTTFVADGVSDYREEATTLSRDMTRSAFPKAA